MAAAVDPEPLARAVEPGPSAGPGLGVADRGRAEQRVAHARRRRHVRRGVAVRLGHRRPQPQPHQRCRGADLSGRRRLPGGERTTARAAGHRGVRPVPRRHAPVPGRRRNARPAARAAGAGEPRGRAADAGKGCAHRRNRVGAASMTVTDPTVRGRDTRLLVEVAAAAAGAGGRVSLAAWHQRAELVVSTKADPDDLVTEADVRTQQAVFEVLGARRPDDRLRGEEELPQPGSAGAGPGGVEGWVDPIAGTTSFVYGRPDWWVSVAAVDRDTGRILAAAVTEPVLDTTITAGLGCGAWCGRRRLTVRACGELARALVEVNLGRARQRVMAGAM